MLRPALAHPCATAQQAAEKAERAGIILSNFSMWLSMLTMCLCGEK
jgi:hypothetical protein